MPIVSRAGHERLVDMATVNLVEHRENARCHVLQTLALIVCRMVSRTVVCFASWLRYCRAHRAAVHRLKNSCLAPTLVLLPLMHLHLRSHMIVTAGPYSLSKTDSLPVST